MGHGHHVSSNLAYPTNFKFKDMSDNKSTGSGISIGFSGLLAILFIALKLTGYITWSWLWVLSPIWITVLVWVVILIVLFVWLGIIKKPKQ